MKQSITTPSSSHGRGLTAQQKFMRRRQITHVMITDFAPVVIAVMVLCFWPALTPSIYDFGIILIMWLVTMLGVTVGYHRLFTHRAFRCGNALKIVLGVAGSLSASGPVIAWVATHRKHHQASDKDGDPHSPNLSGEGLLGNLLGLVHAQIGWTTGHDFPSPLTHARDLLGDSSVVWVNRNYARIAVVGVIAPALVIQYFSPGWHSFLTCIIWAGLFRISLVHQLISSVNSICHFFGTRTYPTKDQSRNNILLALPTVGEAWHNNHHKYPQSAYIGLRWWEIDLGGWVVSALQVCGLIWNVNDARNKQFQVSSTNDADNENTIEAHKNDS